jgi:protocatechuate 4,5-dioxygenase alpha chain
MADDRRAEAGGDGARPQLVHALGGNIYFLARIGATDGKSFQQMAGSMTGMSEEEYRNMMVAGGRSVEGNRRIGEDGDAQAHRQPQGAGSKKEGN